MSMVCDGLTHQMYNMHLVWSTMIAVLWAIVEDYTAMPSFRRRLTSVPLISLCV